MYGYFFQIAYFYSGVSESKKKASLYREANVLKVVAVLLNYIMDTNFIH
jgi:hypothetical protein